MNFYRSLFVFAVLCSYISFGIAFGGYWFQFGVRGGQRTTFNNGASVNIQTITNQNLKTGSSGYWVGENLENGAFIQMGYLIENQSGVYPSICSMSGCGGFENISSGNAEWFYEYFPPSFSGSFLGVIGPDGSAGKNGSINNYGFYANGSTWNLIFNGNIVGSVNLGTNTSGQNIPIAFGELANASNSDTVLKDVIFNNLKFYYNGNFLLVPNGYNYIGYGEGSKTNIQNPYGVKEIGNKINYFEVGSGLPQDPNNTRLWTLGYTLNINSSYAGISGTNGYVAYSGAQISAPSIFNINNGTRAVFLRWVGSGIGSYTGISNSTTIYLDQNITENAVWQLQYYLNINTLHGTTTGSGWYGANSIVNYSVNSNIIYSNSTSRYVFNGWSNGKKQINQTLVLSSPISIHPVWSTEYYISIASQFGNTSGSGWYPANSTANISLKKSVINVTPYEKIAFYSWNDGVKTQNISLKVLNPISIAPIYKKQYLTTFVGVDENNNPVPITNITLNGNISTTSTFLYSGINYTVTDVTYKGNNLPINTTISVTNISRINLILPLYNVSIKTTDLFGIPVNALLTLSFYNGSSYSVYSGSSGTFYLSNVPFGVAKGYASYGSITTAINAVDGNKTSLLFISLLNIEVFILVIVISGVLYIIASKRLKHKEKALESSTSVSDALETQKLPKD